MRLNIIDPNTLELIAVLSNYESVQWSPTFNTTDGSFRIDCSIDYIHLLQNEYLIENTAEPEHIGVVKKVQTVTSNEKTSLQINGVMLEKDLFYKRVIKAFIMYQDVHPIEVVENLIGICMTDPAENARKLNLIGEVITPKKDDFDEDVVPIQYSCNYANLGDEIFTLIQNADLGVKARINRTTNKIDVEFYFGVDRTLGSDEMVVFSPERGTVIDTTYLMDSSQNFTNLIAIGADNVILQVERERQEGEPMLEKSVDLSSECPWPTYSVEKPEEDGGKYYRYKKYNPPADLITNRDVWEKYEVEKIESKQKCYREVEGGTETSITEEEILANSELSRTKNVIKTTGLILDSAVSTLGALASYKRNNGNVGKTEIGHLFGKAKTVTQPTTQSINEKSRSAAKIMSVGGSSEEVKKTTARAQKVTSKVNNLTSASKGNSSNKYGLSPAFKPAELVTQDGKTLYGKIGEDGTMSFYTKDIEMEEYEVDVVTYETKDFLEYVYVNVGQDPSTATKIIQGSVASGDVMYYENYEDIKIAEKEYRDILNKKATEYLRTFVVGESVEITPYKLSNMVYRENYNLGDLVTARNKIQGFSKDFILTSVVETWDSKGYSIEITLGDDVPSLTNRIKLLSKNG